MISSKPLQLPHRHKLVIAGNHDWCFARAPAAARSSDDNRSSPDDFFQRLAAHWKRAYTQHPAGWTAWVLTPDLKLPSKMRLKESRRVPMWNGPIECRMFRFDLRAGSMRNKPADGATAQPNEGNEPPSA